MSHIAPERPVILLLGPSREAIGGVSTHVNVLMDSALRTRFSLAHFQVGSERPKEGRLAQMLRLCLSPIVTPVGGVPDVLVDGEHGHLVAPRCAEAVARAVRALAADRQALARMSAACRARIAAAYSSERVANDFTMLYSRL